MGRYRGAGGPSRVDRGPTIPSRDRAATRRAYPLRSRGKTQCKLSSFVNRISDLFCASVKMSAVNIVQ